jgi:hypothetical protein
VAVPAARVAPVQERLFPDWSMGFHEVSTADLDSVEGYTEFRENMR